MSRSPIRSSSSRPSSSRASRAVVAGLALPLSLFGCSDSRPATSPPSTPDAPLDTPQQTRSFLQTVGNELDVLFMLDNSSSMMPLQTAMLEKLAVFVDQLKDLNGGMPDLHVGVISSDLGTGSYRVPGCPTPGGDAGQLQSRARQVGCVGPTGAPYLQVGTDPATGSVTTNFQGDLAQAFSCIGLLGSSGCGFESPFGSVKAALGPSAPATNLGFLRPEASLMVVLVTNEDDCSVPPGHEDLFDPAMTDPYGALFSYRCTEFGIVCDQGKPPHLPPSEPLTLTGCRSAEDGKLERVADFVAFLKSLKSDPSKLFLSAIAPEPSSVVVGATNLGGIDVPTLQHVCPVAAADPAIRIKEAVTAFGDRGSFQSICADDWTTPLGRVGRLAASATGPTCLPGKIARTSAGAPSCRVTEGIPGGATHDVPACDATGGEAPCWHLEDDAACAGGQKVVVTRAGGVRPPAGVETKLSCDICLPDASGEACR